LAVAEDEVSGRLLSETAVVEHVVKRSRFIGMALRIAEASPTEALAASHERFPDAGHHAWAFRFSSGEEGADDAGEPQGTAGLPLLDVLRRHQVLRAAVVVVRYFGGVKLGRPGLYRAYREAAEAAVVAARPAPIRPLLLIRVAVDYTAYEPFRRWLDSVPHRDAADVAFAERATWVGWIQAEDKGALSALRERWYAAMEITVEGAQDDVL